MSEKQVVFVVCGNDYPDSVFSTEAAAEAYVDVAAGEGSWSCAHLLALLRLRRGWTQPMSGWLPKVGSVWQHGDGGHYVVEANQGRVKFDESEWEPAVRYDHCDGTPSQGPYTTNRSRWEARFKFVAPSLRAWRGETNERSEM